MKGFETKMLTQKLLIKFLNVLNELQIEKVFVKFVRVLPLDLTRKFTISTFISTGLKGFENWGF